MPYQWCKGVFCRRKRSLYGLYSNCHSQKLKAYYTQYCIILCKIMSGKKIYFNQLISMITKRKLHGILLREEQKQNITLYQAFCT